MDLWKKIYSFLFIMIIISYSKVIGNTIILSSLISSTSLIFLIYPFLLIPELLIYSFYLYYTKPLIVFDPSILYLTIFVLIVCYSVFINASEQIKRNKQSLFLKNIMLHSSIYTGETTLKQSKNLNSIINNSIIVKEKNNYPSISFLENEFDDIVNLYNRLININYYTAKFIDYVFTNSLKGFDQIKLENIRVIDCILDALELYQPLDKQIEIKIDKDFYALASKFHLTYFIACIFNIAISCSSKVYIFKEGNNLIIELDSTIKDINEPDITSLKKIYRGVIFETQREGKYLFKIDFNKRYDRMFQVLANKIKP